MSLTRVHLLHSQYVKRKRPTIHYKEMFTTRPQDDHVCNQYQAILGRKKQQTKTKQMKTNASLVACSLTLYNKNTIQLSPCITSHSCESILSASVSMVMPVTGCVLATIVLDANSIKTLLLILQLLKHLVCMSCKKSRQMKHRNFDSICYFSQT